MCGRYSLVASIAELEGRFGFDGADAAYSPSYNVAPTQGVLTVVSESEARHAVRMRWGLIPSWAREASIGSRMINARAETVAEKPSLRTALRRRRCLVLADGFYEWRRTGAGKRPMRITMASGEPFAFAGLWDTWRDPQDETVTSCTIITTGANDLLRPIHDRMPVILQRDQEDLWLDRDVQEPDVLREALIPYDPGSMKAYEVSTLVNSPVNDGPEVIRESGIVPTEHLARPAATHVCQSVLPDADQQRLPGRSEEFALIMPSQVAEHMMTLQDQGGDSRSL